MLPEQHTPRGDEIVPEASFFESIFSLFAGFGHLYRVHAK